MSTIKCTVDMARPGLPKASHDSDPREKTSSRLLGLVFWAVCT